MVLTVTATNNDNKNGMKLYWTLLKQAQETKHYENSSPE